MKTLKQFTNKALLVIFSLLLMTVSFAQETKKIDVDINMHSTDGVGFWSSPWVWIVGVAVFILLLVALMRGNSRSDV